MGNNSNEIKGTDHTRIDSETTETDPTLECTTHEGMPFSVEQKACHHSSVYTLSGHKQCCVGTQCPNNAAGEGHCSICECAR